MYLRKKHFKMETMLKVLNLVQKGDYAINLDLKDGYFHMKMFKVHRKYLRFAFQGVTYQGKAMCFGPTVSPRVFCHDNVCSGIIFTEAWNSSVLLSGRLASSKSVKGETPTGPFMSHESPFSTRFHGQQKEIFSKCLLRHDVVSVFVSSLVLVFVRAILSWCP